MGLYIVFYHFLQQLFYFPKICQRKKLNPEWRPTATSTISPFPFRFVIIIKLSRLVFFLSYGLLANFQVFLEMIFLFNFYFLTRQAGKEKKKMLILNHLTAAEMRIKKLTAFWLSSECAVVCYRFMFCFLLFFLDLSRLVWSLFLTWILWRCVEQHHCKMPSSSKFWWAAHACACAYDIFYHSTLSCITWFGKLEIGIVCVMLS